MKRIIAALLLLMTVHAVHPCSAAVGSQESSDTSAAPTEPQQTESQPLDPGQSEPVQTETQIGEYTLTLIFIDENGNEVTPKKMYVFKTGDSYNVTPPPKGGYTTEPQTVSGIMGNRDLTVTVVYKKNAETESATESETEPEPEPGIWSVTLDGVRYSEGGKAVTGSVTIDGKEYHFGADGNLIYDGFLELSGKTVYLENGKPAVGYKVIEGALYCFDSSGYMIVDSTLDGHTFDISGRVTDEDGIININGKSYLLQNHVLYQGYYMLGENIVFFGYDYAMVTNSQNEDGCVFDESGSLVSGIYASALTASGLKNVAYTGDPCNPEFSVKFGNIVLIEGVHYTLKYSDNTNPGIATVTVTGLGPIKGNVDFHFSILSSNTKKLTIKYRNEAGMSVSSTYENAFEPGQEYSIKSPKIDGYTPDKEIVEGVMGNENLEVVVIYSKTAGAESESGTTATEAPLPLDPDPTNTDDQSTTPSPKYNLKLFFGVFAVSTVVIGSAIALILNWDLIKKKASSPRRKKKPEKKKA